MRSGASDVSADLGEAVRRVRSTTTQRLADANAYLSLERFAADPVIAGCEVNSQSLVKICHSALAAEWRGRYVDPDFKHWRTHLRRRGLNVR